MIHHRRLVQKRTLARIDPTAVIRNRSSMALLSEIFVGRAAALFVLLLSSSCLSSSCPSSSCSPRSCPSLGCSPRLVSPRLVPPRLVLPRLLLPRLVLARIVPRVILPCLVPRLVHPRLDPFLFPPCIGLPVLYTYHELVHARGMWLLADMRVRYFGRMYAQHQKTDNFPLKRNVMVIWPYHCLIRS